MLYAAQMKLRRMRRIVGEVEKEWIARVPTHKGTGLAGKGVGQVFLLLYRLAIARAGTQVPTMGTTLSLRPANVQLHYRVMATSGAGDAGTAVGAAYFVYHQVLGQPRTFEMRHAYTGPSYSNAAIDEIFSTSLIPTMFAQVAQEKITPAEAVSGLDAQASSRALGAASGRSGRQMKIR